MYRKQNNFDKSFELASARYGIEISWLKAIAGVESEFEDHFKSATGKTGIMGLTLDYVKRHTPSFSARNPELKLEHPAEHDLLDAHFSIMMAAHLIRTLFNELDNPNGFDVIRAYGTRNVSSRDIGGYVSKVWQAINYFSGLADQPYSSSPREVEGVYLRKG